MLARLGHQLSPWCSVKHNLTYFRIESVVKSRHSNIYIFWTDGRSPEMLIPFESSWTARVTDAHTCLWSPGVTLETLHKLKWSPNGAVTSNFVNRTSYWMCNANKPDSGIQWVPGFEISLICIEASPWPIKPIYPAHGLSTFPSTHASFPIYAQKCVKVLVQGNYLLLASLAHTQSVEVTIITPYP